MFPKTVYQCFSNYITYIEMWNNIPKTSSHKHVAWHETWVYDKCIYILMLYFIQIKDRSG